MPVFFLESAVLFINTNFKTKFLFIFINLFINQKRKSQMKGQVPMKGQVSSLIYQFYNEIVNDQATVC